MNGEKGDVNLACLSELARCAIVPAVLDGFGVVPGGYDGNAQRSPARDAIDTDHTIFLQLPQAMMRV